MKWIRSLKLIVDFYALAGVEKKQCADVASILKIERLANRIGSKIDRQARQATGLVKRANLRIEFELSKTFDPCLAKQATGSKPQSET